MTDYAVIIVGGIPCVGKTSMCGYLARRFNIDIMLSTDYLREFLRSAVSEDKAYDFLNSTVYDAWKKFGERNKENIVKGYREQGKIISKGINALIERSNKNKESLIIESLYFMPDQLPALNNSNVISFYIQVSDNERYKKMITERAEFTHPGQSGDRLIMQVDAYKFMAEDALESCKKNGIPVFDNLDYIRTRNDIVKFVESKI
ncbi:MAG: P-loop NTPase family protein [Candidatus Micrarchaeaceae archaeon]